MNEDPACGSCSQLYIQALSLQLLLTGVVLIELICRSYYCAIHRLRSCGNATSRTIHDISIPDDANPICKGRPSRLLLLPGLDIPGRIRLMLPADVATRGAAPHTRTKRLTRAGGECKMSSCHDFVIYFSCEQESSVSEHGKQLQDAETAGGPPGRPSE